jgi:hypothetical protein
MIIGRIIRNRRKEKREREGGKGKEGKGREMEGERMHHPIVSRDLAVRSFVPQKKKGLLSIGNLVFLCALALFPSSHLSSFDIKSSRPLPSFHCSLTS